MQTLGLIVAILFLLLMLFNGVMMALSPNRWFDLPFFIRFKGNLRRDRLYRRSTQISIRLFGLMLALGTFGIFMSIFGLARPSMGDFELSPLHQRILCLTVCMSVVVFGLSGMFRSYWTIQHSVESEDRAHRERRWIMIKHVVSFVLIAHAISIAWPCLKGG